MATFITPSICVRFVSTAKNLGFQLDSLLNFNSQIKALKSSCFHKLRNIAKMQPFLNTKQLQSLTQALVISSLDYCNALYYGIDANLLNQLQIIQNRACRTVLGLRKREHVTQHLEDLHWLKVQERIEFKVLLLVYKALNGLSPEYLAELISYNNISGSRTPSLLSPVARTSKGIQAFQYYAPRLWNNTPYNIRQCDNIFIFKKKLKTYLFTKSYP